MPAVYAHALVRKSLDVRDAERDRLGCFIGLERNAKFRMDFLTISLEDGEGGNRNIETVSENATFEE